MIISSKVIDNCHQVNFFLPFKWIQFTIDAVFSLIRANLPQANTFHVGFRINKGETTTLLSTPVEC